MVLTLPRMPAHCYSYHASIPKIHSDLKMRCCFTENPAANGFLSLGASPSCARGAKPDI